MIDLGLDGARAVVVGAGFIPSRAGHGRGSALRLAAAGATVACVDMDEGRAHDIVGEITAEGGKAFAVVGDVRTEAEAKRIVGRGQAEAAVPMRTFEQNPDLANLLLRLGALETSLKDKSTLIFDERTPPFDLFKGFATNSPTH